MTMHEPRMGAMKPPLGIGARGNVEAHGHGEEVKEIVQTFADLIGELALVMHHWKCDERRCNNGDQTGQSCRTCPK